MLLSGWMLPKGTGYHRVQRRGALVESGAGSSVSCSGLRLECIVVAAAVLASAEAMLTFVVVIEGSGKLRSKLVIWPRDIR